MYFSCVVSWEAHYFQLQFEARHVYLNTLSVKSYSWPSFASQPNTQSDFYELLSSHLVKPALFPSLVFKGFCRIVSRCSHTRHTVFENHQGHESAATAACDFSMLPNRCTATHWSLNVACADISSAHLANVPVGKKKCFLQVRLLFKAQQTGITHIHQSAGQGAGATRKCQSLSRRYPVSTTMMGLTCFLVFSPPVHPAHLWNGDEDAREGASSPLHACLGPSVGATTHTSPPPPL